MRGGVSYLFSQGEYATNKGHIGDFVNARPGFRAVIPSIIYSLFDVFAHVFSIMERHDLNTYENMLTDSRLNRLILIDQLDTGQDAFSQTILCSNVGDRPLGDGID